MVDIQCIKNRPDTALFILPTTMYLSKRNCSYYFLPNMTSSTPCPFLLYSTPASTALPQGLYALIGHHPKPGIEANPPMMRPLPSQPNAILSFAIPHVGQVLALEALTSCVSFSFSVGEELCAATFRCDIHETCGLKQRTCGARETTPVDAFCLFVAILVFILYLFRGVYSIDLRLGDA